ncbi:MAG: penicillin-binding protein 1A [Pseudobdellovibrionaceae bacterium]
MKFLGRMILFLISLGFIGAIAGVIVLGAVIYKYGQNLPDFQNLKDYQPSVVTRVYAADGRFLAEFAQERRIFVPVSEIPDRVKQAFTSAEDQNFYRHKGVDLFAVARAIVTNLRNHGSRMVGASTITQQVAKNFLLTNERSFERKIREAIISYRMEQIFTKDHILELYLNQIFLGSRSYGVAAASLNYFNKPLSQLTVAEAAYLAALPKAPNNYNPATHYDEAIGRRNWVIDRMLDDGHITQAEADIAKASPLQTVERENNEVVDAPYFAEEVRRELIKRFGEETNTGGFAVRTSIDPKLQAFAEIALQNGIIAYDRRTGWRGPLESLHDTSEWMLKLKDYKTPPEMIARWNLAMVLSAKKTEVEIGLRDGRRVQLPASEIEWAKSKPLSAGDVIMVEETTETTEKDGGKDGTKTETAVIKLRQIPKVQGALVALDPHTGRVLAMQGGWKATGNEFNRATQAMRQPGSAFKPFVYLAALDKGYTPSSIILDSPITFTDTAGNVWQPENYSGEFYGPTPLRVGVEKSRNLMTIRLAQQIGIQNVVDYAKRFGISDTMQPHLSNALGSQETTVLKLTAAYGMIVNGGTKITPSFIDRIQDRNGKTIFTAGSSACAGCGPLIRWEGQSVPEITEQSEQIADPRTAYQMVSILEGVVQRGTGKSLMELDIPIAGKTGTTNDSKDAWFVGFTPDLAAGVYIGFDDPKSLGKKETGASAALPVFKEFMKNALKDVPPTPFRIPKDVRMVLVNAANGRPTSADDPNAIWEPFLAGTEPDASGSYTPPSSDSAYSAGSEHIDSVVDQSVTNDILQPNPDDQQPSLQGTGGLY